jgi:hypothetical protein
MLNVIQRVQVCCRSGFCWACPNPDPTQVIRCCVSWVAAITAMSVLVLRFRLHVPIQQKLIDPRIQRQKQGSWNSALCDSLLDFGGRGGRLSDVRLTPILFSNGTTLVLSSILWSSKMSCMRPWLYASRPTSDVPYLNSSSTPSKACICNHRSSHGFLAPASQYVSCLINFPEHARGAI